MSASAAKPSRWRRIRDWIVGLEEMLSFDMDELRDRRIERLEAEVERLRCRMNEALVDKPVVERVEVGGPIAQPGTSQDASMA